MTEFNPALTVKFEHGTLLGHSDLAPAQPRAWRMAQIKKKPMKQHLPVAVLAIASLSTSIASAGVVRPPNVTCDFGKEADTGLVIVSGSLPTAVVGHGVPTSAFFEYNGVGKSSLTESNILLDRKGGLGNLPFMSKPAGPLTLEASQTTSASSGKTWSGKSSARLGTR